MLNETVHRELNRQLNMELSASHTYLAMAGYFEGLTLPGFAHWFMVQSREEREHALRIYNYLNDRGASINLSALPEPRNEYGSVLEVIETALEHEQKVTASIHSIYKLAGEYQDYATQSLLKWYIDEQVEEEKNADELIQRLKLVGGAGTGLFMLDAELARRGGENEAAAVGEEE